MFADVTADFVYARLQKGTDDTPTCYPPDDIDLWAKRLRTYAAGGVRTIFRSMRPTGRWNPNLVMSLPSSSRAKGTTRRMELNCCKKRWVPPLIYGCKSAIAAGMCGISVSAVMP